MLLSNLLLLAAAALLTVKSAEHAAIQTGLCGGEGAQSDSPQCTELEEGETCENTNSHENDWTDTCSEPDDGSMTVHNIPSDSCFDSNERWTGEPCLTDVDIQCDQGTSGQSCVSHSDSTWEDLQLELTYTGVSSSHYAVDVRWRPPRDTVVPGYILVVSNYNNGLTINSWNRCNNYRNFKDDNICRRCVIHLDNTTYHYRVEQLDVLKYDRTDVPKYIKLIPSDWCDGPSKVIAPPKTCNHVCPGNCRLCAHQSSPDEDESYLIDHLHPPRELLNYSACLGEDATFSLTFHWETGIDYVRSNPSPIYYFFLSTAPRGVGRISRSIKTTRMPVTLRNLTLQEGSTYYINIQQYECVCTRTRSIPFEISSQTNACNGVATQAPPTVTFASPTIPITTTTLSSTIFPSPVSSIDNSTPTHLPVIASVLAFTTLVVVVALVVTLLLKFVLCRSLRRPHVSHSHQISPTRKEKLRVLVLYSWGTSEQNQQHILQRLSLLAYDAELVCSAKAHVRGNVPQWVETHVRDSDKVLIVCNKEFSREWRSPGHSHAEGAITNSLKIIINGHVNNGTVDELCCKMALVFLKEKHKSLVPSEILHNFKQYVLYSEESSKHDELNRFVSDTPMFQFCHEGETKSNGLAA